MSLSGKTAVLVVLAWSLYDRGDVYGILSQIKKKFWKPHLQQHNITPTAIKYNQVFTIF